MIRISFPILLAATCIMASCKDTIEVDFREGKEYIVIGGRITNENFYHPITITRSTHITSTEAPQTVTNARVKVTDSNGNVYNYQHYAQGEYESLTYYEGEPGVTYNMEVKVDLDNDGIYEIFTASDIMRSNAEVDRIKLEPYKLLSKELTMVLIWGRLPETKRENDPGYCFNIIVGSLDDYKPYSDMMLMNEELNDNLMLDSLPTFSIDLNNKEYEDKFEAGNLVEFKILSPSEQYYDFLRASKENTTSNIPVYGGPPANSSTNIRQTGGTKTPVTGFFAACSESKIYTILERQSRK